MEITDDEIRDLFTPPGSDKPICVNCIVAAAVAIHEIEPRSKRPRTWREPSNRITVCNECHDWIHSMGTANVDRLLRDRRRRALDLTGKAAEAAELQARWEEQWDSKK